MIRLALAALIIALPAAAQEDMNFGDEEAEPATDAPPEEKPADAPAEPVEPETPATADDEEKSAIDEGIDLTLQDRIKAVSRKTFLKQGRFELQPAVMVTTNDPFFRSWFLAGRATYHVNDAFGIEVGGGYVPPFLVQKLPPVDVLREQAFLINADAKLLGLADLGVTFSPLYGKVAVLSDQIIHFDAFVIAGVGSVFDTNKGFIAGAPALHPSMDVGGGLRVFILHWLVVRADVRDYVYPQDRTGISTLQNLLLVSLGVGFYFPFEFTYQYEAAKVR